MCSWNTIIFCPIVVYNDPGGVGSQDPEHSGVPWASLALSDSLPWRF